MGWAFAAPFIGFAVLAVLIYAWPVALIGAVIWAVVYFAKKGNARQQSNG